MMSDNANGLGNSNQTIIIEESATPMQNTLEYSARNFSTWCVPQGSAPSSPMCGHMAPMADVSSSSWASNPTTMNLQQGLQAQSLQVSGDQPESFCTTPSPQQSRVQSTPSSGHTTPGKLRKRNRENPTGRNRQIHGERVLAAAGAHMLWGMLDERAKWAPRP